MSKSRNITVPVSEDLYRQTRRLAVENDSTVSSLVRYLLYCLPLALKAAPMPPDSNSAPPPDFGRAFELAKQNKEPWPPPIQPIPAPKTSGFVRPRIGK